MASHPWQEARQKTRHARHACPGAEMCGDGKAAAFWAKAVKKYGGNVD